MNKGWCGAFILTWAGLAGAEDFDKANQCYQAKDYSCALAEYLPLAKQGQAAAQNSLGIMYERGYGVEQDNYQAFEWYQKAAEQNFPEAQVNLGLLYLANRSSEDHSKVKMWFEKAAVEGHELGEYYLGLLYLQGEGIPRDVKKALSWLKKSAKQGVTESTLLVAMLYQTGQGVEQDAQEAVEWLRRGVLQGSAKAAEALALTYYHGEGVVQDFDETLFWLDKMVELSGEEPPYLQSIKKDIAAKRQ